MFWAGANEQLIKRSGDGRLKASPRVLRTKGGIRIYVALWKLEANTEYSKAI